MIHENPITSSKISAELHVAYWTSKLDASVRMTHLKPIFCFFKNFNKHILDFLFFFFFLLILNMELANVTSLYSLFLKEFLRKGQQFLKFPRYGFSQVPSKTMQCPFGSHEDWIFVAIPQLLHELILLSFWIKVIGECYRSQVSDEVLEKYRALVGSKDCDIFLEFCLHTILYQPSPQRLELYYLISVLIM